MHTAVCAEGTLITVSSATYNSGSNDRANGVAVDSEDNIIVTGASNEDYFTIKYSSDLAAVISSHRHDGGYVGYTDDQANGVTIDSKDNIIVTGYTDKGDLDYFTIKYSSDLAIVISSHTYDTGFGEDEGRAVSTDSEDNIIVTGIDGNNDYFTIKYSSDLATIISSHTYNTGTNDETYGVVVDSEDNIIVTGYSNNDYFTIKYSSDLATIISSATYSSGNIDHAHGVAVDSEGNIIVTGKSNNDYFTIKYNSDLDTVISSATYNSGATDEAHGIAVDAEGNIIVTGKSNNDYFIIKYSSDLDTIISSATYDSGYSDGANAVAVDSDGNIIVTGQNNNGSDNDYFTIKYNGLSPTVTSLSPSSATQGETKDVTITGDNFYDGASVSFSGAGIVINSTDVVSKTQIDMNISIDGEAAPGSRDVTVTNIDTGADTKVSGFEVLLLTPTAPSNFTGTAVSSTTILFGWTDNSAYEDGFRIYSSTGWLITSLLANTTEWMETDLTANTSSYAWEVRSYKGAGEDTGSMLSSVVYSSANVPTGSYYYETWPSSATYAWDANSNPSGTEYAAQISTSTGFEVGITTTTSWQTALSYEFTSLRPNTTYYAQVKARNFNEEETVYDTYASTTTLLLDLSLAVDDGAFTWVTGGNADWFGEVDEYYYDNDAAQSGAISDNQSSYMQTTITGPQTVSFYWKVSSEQNNDNLSFYIDGVLQGEISGEVDWTLKAFEIPSGAHILKWEYKKNAGTSSGSDAGWVDKFIIGSGSADFVQVFTSLEEGFYNSSLSW
ncbi:SBBP repeat-containing protein, partial [bacterium]